MRLRLPAPAGLTRRDRLVLHVGLVLLALSLVTLALFLVFAFTEPDMHLSADGTLLFNTACGLAWFAMLLASLGLIVARIVAFLREHDRVPWLLWRDLLSKWGLAMPLVLVFMARFYNSAIAQSVPPASLQTWLPWLVWTTLPPIMGMGTFLFYEVFVIGRWQTDDGSSRTRPDAGARSD
jgi:Na+-driven multidrug efflux pump